MEGGVNHFEFIRHFFDHFFIDGLGHDLLHESVIGLLAQNLDHAALDSLVKITALEAGEDIDGFHLLGDGVRLLGGQLGAVGPVDLVAVILLGVVAGGDVQAGDSAIVQHGKAQLRGGAQGVKDAHMHAVGSHDTGGLPGEGLAVEAAVISDGDAPALCFLALGGNNVGKGLGGVTDDVHVHVVQAQLHGASETGSAELQRGKEAVLDLLLVAGDGVKLCPFLLAEGGAVQPVLIFFLVVSCHGNFLLYNWSASVSG